MRQLTVGPRGIGGRVAAYDKLAYHARNAKKQHAGKIKQNKGRPTVVAGHVRKAPHVAKPYGRAGRGKDDTQAASKIYSVSVVHYIQSIFRLVRTDEEISAICRPDKYTLCRKDIYERTCRAGCPSW